MMDPRVRVIETSIILPATYTPESTPQRIDLTPWDLQLLLCNFIQKGILFSHCAPDFVHLLKASLSHTLDYFYPLAGRLSCDEDVSKDAKLYYIECNNGGVEFVHAVMDSVTVPQILDPVYDSEIIHGLFPQNGLQNIDCDVKPFFAVQVTELAGGGCFIGCSMSHVFGDGTSFWHFLNSWSEICRGCHCISNLPVLDRQYPHQSQVWIPSTSIVRKPVYENLIIFKERMFHFPKEKIASLKQKAIRETGNQRISSLQTILAYVWRAVLRSRGTDPKEDVHFIMGIGDRTRTEPPLPTYYLGNALRVAKGSMKGEEILAESGLGRAACQLNKLVSSQTGTAVLDFIHSWSTNPTLLHPGTVARGNSLITSSSPKFNVYGCDFGWGRPVAVRSGGGNKNDGKLTIFTGAEDGSVDIEISMLVEAMEVLERDIEFMDVAH